VEHDPRRLHPDSPRDHLPASIEEDDVQREPHPEGVDAAAARDQQTRAGPLAVEERESEQPRDRAVRHANAMARDGCPWPATQAARDSIAILGHDIRSSRIDVQVPPTRPVQVGVQPAEGNSAPQAHT
jgi:hypothetical protein